MLNNFKSLQANGSSPPNASQHDAPIVFEKKSAKGSRKPAGKSPSDSIQPTDDIVATTAKSAPVKIAHISTVGRAVGVG